MRDETKQTQQGQHNSTMWKVQNPNDDNASTVADNKPRNGEKQAPIATATATTRMTTKSSVHNIRSNSSTINISISKTCLLWSLVTVLAFQYSALYRLHRPTTTTEYYGHYGKNSLHGPPLQLRKQGIEQVVVMPSDDVMAYHHLIAHPHQRQQQPKHPPPIVPKQRRAQKSANTMPKSRKQSAPEITENEIRNGNKGSTVFKENKKQAKIQSQDSDSDSDKESFSACLLLMDDNHRLAEWLAYHYFALPLRYLVVAVDPRSQTSPSSILQMWRQDTKDKTAPHMTIVEWSDDDIGLKPSVDQLQTDDVAKKTALHRLRQRLFYTECTKHLKRHNKTWTAYIDVDEYFSLNSALVGNETTETLMEVPGSILQFFKDTLERKEYSSHVKVPCTSIPRIFYGAVPSTPQQVAAGVPAGINASKFDTLSYRYRALGTDRVHNGKSKAIVDISTLPNSLLDDKKVEFSVHRPVKSCPFNTVGMNKVPILLHHYLGSWEAYSARDDARRGHEKSRAVWDVRANITAKETDEGRSWIRGFVKTVGRKHAQRLLAPVGVIERPTNVNWDDRTGYVDALKHEMQVKKAYAEKLARNKGIHPEVV